jgi:hypothetical protein
MTLINANTCVFDNNDITTVPGLDILSVNSYIPPKRRLSISDIVRSNKSKHNSGFYNQRQITVRVRIARASRQLLEVSIDQLMSMVQGINKILELPRGLSTEQFYATLTDSVVDANTAGGAHIEIDLIFECSDRFGYSKVPVVLLAITSAFTSSYRSDRIQFTDGSAPTQVPVTTITYSAVSGGSAKTVRIGNGQSGQEVAITRTWAAGDKIEIDSYNKTVKVNNAEVAFTGAIPEWKNSVSNPFGYWYYSGNFTTSRSFTGQVVYYPRYL